jgi:hypothetical protein
VHIEEFKITDVEIEEYPYNPVGICLTQENSTTPPKEALQKLMVD